MKKLLSNKNYRSIEAGAGLAEFHAEMMTRHEIEHQIRHELDESFDCAEFHAEFRQHIHADVHQHSGDPYFIASYATTANRIAKKKAKANGTVLPAGGAEGPEVPDFDALAKMFPGAAIVPMEPPRNGETPSEFVERLRRMASDEAAFREQVSENQKPDSGQNQKPDPRETIFDPHEDRITFTPEEEAAEPEGEDGEAQE